MIDHGGEARQAIGEDIGFGQQLVCGEGADLGTHESINHLQRHLLRLAVVIGLYCGHKGRLALSAASGRSRLRRKLASESAGIWVVGVQEARQQTNQSERMECRQRNDVE